MRIIRFLTPDGREHLGVPSGSDKAVILVAHDTNDPNVHSDVAKLARLTFETYPLGWVDAAFMRSRT